MRCSCTECGTYMVHNENASFGCVCPECRNTCRLCLGTGPKPGIVRTKDGKVSVPDEILERYGRVNDTNDKDV